ncbi:hypothetical protein K438DRAFT_1971586 [Mycena galopus ATCC 62051]|nr:hypothetical protein K438DRAFT_1971586 [Mycena galopus ATCC 62051]
MNHVFIDCPNPACTERIPSRLKCRGHNTPEHKGLDYQVCTPCGYFKWLDPHAADEADDPWARSPPPPALEWLDPTLSMPVPSQTTFPMVSPSQVLSLPPPSSQNPPASQSSSNSKPRCALRTCTRRALSKDCTHGMCKTCCEQQQKGCRYAPHRTQPTAQASSSHGDPSALSRPPPMFPTSLPSPSTPSSLNNDAGTLPLKLYKKPMNEEWARRYNATHAEREERKAAEAQRREQQQLFDRQVSFYCWMQDNEEPEFVRLQGITTFPKLNIADHPKVLQTFGLTIDDNIWIYDMDGGSFMREDVNHIMEVTSHQRILTRLAGVKKCPGVDELIDKYCRNWAAIDSSRRLLPVASRKRKAPPNAIGVFPMSLKTSKLTLLTRPSTPPSPCSSSSSSPCSLITRIIDLSSPPPSPTLSRRNSSSPVHSPLSPPSTAPTALLPPPAAPTAPHNPDSLWAEQRVFVQSGFGDWPNGVYVRDMVRAFGFVKKKKLPTLAEWFLAVFDTVDTFPRSNWHKQVSAWELCSQHKRDTAAALPRTPEALWTTWRARSSGWVKSTAKGKLKHKDTD